MWLTYKIESFNIIMKTKYKIVEQTRETKTNHLKITHTFIPMYKNIFTFFIWKPIGWFSSEKEAEIAIEFHKGEKITRKNIKYFY